jgi:hypothetical protein
MLRALAIALLPLAAGCVTATTYHALVSRPDYVELEDAHGLLPRGGRAVTVRVHLDDGRVWEYGPITPPPPVAPTKIPLAPPLDLDESPLEGRPAGPGDGGAQVVHGPDWLVLDRGPFNYPRGHVTILRFSEAGAPTPTSVAIVRPERPPSLGGAILFVLAAPFTVAADVITAPLQIVAIIFLPRGPTGA